MSSRFCRSVVCTVLVSGLSTVLWAKPRESAGDQVENPVYTAWAKFEPGTVAVWKIVKSDGDEKSQSTVERRLIEVTDAKIVLKRTTQSEGDNAPESKTVEIARMIPATKARVWTDPVGKKEEREETVTVLKPKKAFKTRVLVSATKSKKGETTTTEWLSDEVPGLLLKREVVAADHQTTMELARLTQPKKGGTIAAKTGKPKGPKAKAVWITNYENALATARAEKKLVLLDFTGSDWCGWCIKLDKEVFETREFKTWAADKLVLVKLDFPRRKEISDKLKKQNDGLAKKHGIQGFPTLVIVNPSGKEVGKLGYVAGGPKNWIAEADKILSSANADSSVLLPSGKVVLQSAR